RRVRRGVRAVVHSGRAGSCPQPSTGRPDVRQDRRVGTPGRPEPGGPVWEPVRGRSGNRHGAGMGTGTGPVWEPVRGTVRGSVQESAGAAGIGRRTGMGEAV